MRLLIYLCAVIATSSSVEEEKWNIRLNSAGSKGRCIDEVYEVEKRLYLLSSRITQAASDAKRLTSIVNKGLIINLLTSIVNENIGGNIGLSVTSTTLNAIADKNDVDNSNINENDNDITNINREFDGTYDYIVITEDDPLPILKRDEGYIENDTSFAKSVSCDNPTKLCNNSKIDFTLRPHNGNLQQNIPLNFAELFNETLANISPNGSQNNAISRLQHDVTANETLLSLWPLVDMNYFNKVTLNKNSQKPVEDSEPYLISVSDEQFNISKTTKTFSQEIATIKPI